MERYVPPIRVFFFAIGEIPIYIFNGNSIRYNTVVTHVRRYMLLSLRNNFIYTYYAAACPKTRSDGSSQFPINN